MIRYILAGIVAMAAVLAYARFQRGSGEEYEPTSWEWEGDVAAGNWLRIRNTNGEITVSESPTGRARIRATKTRKHGNADNVHFRVLSSGSDVTVCALWSGRDRCDEDDYRVRMNGKFGRKNDTRVAFVVELPRGVKIDAHTINGDVAITGAAAPVRANTVNGDVSAETEIGPVSAVTVNGEISVSMDSIAGDGEIKLTTVNGSIEATMPAQLDADLEVAMLNGRFTTDYPITQSIPERGGPKKVRATLGSGTRDIRITTVNGSVELRKAHADTVPSAPAHPILPEPPGEGRIQ